MAYAINISRKPVDWIQNAHTFASSHPKHNIVNNEEKDTIHKGKMFTNIVLVVVGFFLAVLSIELQRLSTKKEK